MQVPADAEVGVASGFTRRALDQRVTSLACGCLLAGGAALVAFADPSAPGSRFPACAFHQITGLWCPGCGITRAAHHLLRGDLAAALGSNLFAPLVLATIVSVWWVWTARAFGRQVRNPLERLPAWLSPVLLVAVITFGVARNLPFGAVRWLAP